MSGHCTAVRQDLTSEPITSQKHNMDMGPSLGYYGNMVHHSHRISVRRWYRSSSCGYTFRMERVTLATQDYGGHFEHLLRNDTSECTTRLPLLASWSAIGALTYEHVHANSRTLHFKYPYLYMRWECDPCPLTFLTGNGLKFTVLKYCCKVAGHSSHKGFQDESNVKYMAHFHFWNTVEYTADWLQCWIFQGFYLYLYLGSIIFMCFLYAMTLKERAVKNIISRHSK
jgi:hypothetical protein